MTEREWWHPVPTDEKWLAEIRAEYPDTGGTSAEGLRDYYAGGLKYSTTWDHVGDAYDQYEKLADDWLEAKATLGALLDAAITYNAWVSRGAPSGLRHIVDEQMSHAVKEARGKQAPVVARSSGRQTTNQGESDDK